MTHLRKYFIWLHRYLGIPLSGLFVMWFATGVVMMYAGGMPRLSGDMVLSRLSVINFSKVELTPTEAFSKNNRPINSDSLSLMSVMDRPAYRTDHFTIFADTGEELTELSILDCRRIASDFLGLPEKRVEHVGTLLRPDQWTLTYNASLPLHKFRVNDKYGSEIYVSPRFAEVVVLTTRRSRGFAWIGAIPHWFYFSFLRSRPMLWYDLVIFFSVLGCVLAITGLVLGIIQFRWTQTGKKGQLKINFLARVPYVGGLRWHYITGIVFGMFTLTWVFSGLLSMEPFQWTQPKDPTVRADSFVTGAPELHQVSIAQSAKWNQLVADLDVVKMEFKNFQGKSYFVLHTVNTLSRIDVRQSFYQPYEVSIWEQTDQVAIAADTLTIRERYHDEQTLISSVKTALPDVQIFEATMLDSYDSYYFSRNEQRPLPVLRVKLNDSMQTWLYIDPRLGQLLTTNHKFTRIERWMFNGLHSLNFPMLYQQRPLWDLVMIILGAGGLASSGIGFWIGIKRSARFFVRKSS
tara:strand:- start:40296 stop:41852 length:1557 start_codon:yes stop_codon:yes gene_type:complete